jgi:hypothetical protein
VLRDQGPHQLLWVFFQVKIQLGEGSAATVTKKMLANEGIGAFYKVCSFQCSASVIIVHFT